ncbi:DNA-directed RNA polymerase III subunit rpc4 isoform X2 [Prunus yedoensis var. nudiflora]|uniref:DNA-directed RNA polymerase III subunit rpc4 isoform X2 n=1 Tax=Prunus yedoensis var. nudiflora TaxID=2094558 RepID=A0A314YIK6_PRUYE|nr:DNA-directed RNA polymerase III subunit rpc4 isoform X2 [Prunus yedoensis var. nudiflora]
MDKDNDGSSGRPRTHKFIPKGRKKTGAPVPAPEVGDNDDGEKARRAEALLRQFNISSTSIRTYGTAKDGNTGKSSSSVLVDSDDDQSLPTLPEVGKDVSMEDATDVAPLQTVKQRYTECWDSETTYYPTTLPLRKPNSGDPAKISVLNENEFGEDAEKEYDESTINHAAELGLLEEKVEARMLFVQLPTILPLTKRSATAKGKEKVGSSTSLESTGATKKGCSLEELPGGYMGKMLVYKSGAIKLKLGNTLCDVSPGSDCLCDEDVAVITLRRRHVVFLEGSATEL